MSKRSKRGRKSRRAARPSGNEASPPPEGDHEAHRASVPLECFLSHSSRDEKMVDRLADDLARHGIDAWLSFRNISPAQRWQDEIGDALARCKWFLVWLTANAVASRWVKEEVHYAFNDDRLAGRIIPLLRTDCAWKKLHFALGNRQMINFRNYDKGMQELLRVWGIESQPRQ